MTIVIVMAYNWENMFEGTATIRSFPLLVFPHAPNPGLKNVTSPVCVSVLEIGAAQTALVNARKSVTNPVACMTE